MKEKPDFLFSAGWLEKISTHFQKLDARKKILHRGCQGMTQKSHGYIALLILLSNFLLEFASFKRRSSTKVKVIFLIDCFSKKYIYYIQIGDDLFHSMYVFVRHMTNTLKSLISVEF